MSVCMCMTTHVCSGSVYPLDDYGTGIEETIKEEIHGKVLLRNPDRPKT